MEELLAGYGQEGEEREEADRPAEEGPLRGATTTTTPSSACAKRGLASQLIQSTGNSTTAPPIRPYVSKRQRLSTPSSSSSSASSSSGLSSSSSSATLSVDVSVEALPIKLRRLVVGSCADSEEEEQWRRKKRAQHRTKLPNKTSPSLLLRQHGAAVNVLRWSNLTGGYLASASMDGTVRLWDVFRANKAEQRPCESVVIASHEAGVRDIQWSHDNGHLLSGGFDKQVLLTDVQTGQLVQTSKHEEFITALRYHPSTDESNLFLCGGAKSGLFCWDLRTTKMAIRYKGIVGQVQSLEFIKEGEQFVSSADVLKRNSADKGIMVWDFKAGVVISNQVYQEVYTCPWLRAHPDGASFIAQSNAGYITIFSTQPPFKLNKRKRFEGHQVSGYRITCDISPDGMLVASGSTDGKVYFYDWKSSAIVKVLAQPFSNTANTVCTGVVFHPLLPRCLAASGWNGSISIFE
ncbi:WD repeat-containing protein 25 [Balamuthia mandrillaris]